MIKAFNSWSNKWSKARRYRKTLEFMGPSIEINSTVLDIGTPNKFSDIMAEHGLKVINTKGDDLDQNPEVIAQFDTEVATAFEIFEHLLNPLGVLKEIKAETLFASIPLSLWFAKAYRNKNDQWDQHFHEFEDWQFDWLLEKGGWEIVRREKWTSPVFMPGIRPIFRLITPRYYIVEARRKK
ncbi:MAG: methyltransferase [Cyclobacteriaceae bacterium]